MQVDYNSTQNFGMALKVSKAGKEVLTSRIKKDSELDMLSKLVKSQENNPYGVEIRGASYDSKLEAFIKNSIDESDHTLLHLEENWFSQTFKSPIAFIKKACGVADKLNEEKYNPKMSDKINQVLDAIVED